MCSDEKSSSHLCGMYTSSHPCENISNFILIDSDFSMIVEKSASDQLRQMCLSQLTASDDLAEMRNTHLNYGKSTQMFSIHIYIYTCSTLSANFVHVLSGHIKHHVSCHVISCHVLLCPSNSFSTHHVMTHDELFQDILSPMLNPVV